MQTQLNRIYMENSQTKQSPVILIIAQHNLLNSIEFSKWLIANSEKLKSQDTSDNSSVSKILDQHEKLNSLSFTKWLLSNSNDLQA